MKPWMSPSGLNRGIQFVIPDHWSTEQALAIVELLDDLREVIWSRYQIQLCEYLREDRVTESSSDDVIDESDPF